MKKKESEMTHKDIESYCILVKFKDGSIRQMFHNEGKEHKLIEASKKDGFIHISENTFNDIIQW